MFGLVQVRRNEAGMTKIGVAWLGAQKPTRQGRSGSGLGTSRWGRPG